MNLELSIKVPVGVNATRTTQTKTQHWFADSAVGRDFGIGTASDRGRSIIPAASRHFTATAAST
jgi:hypothetical protein